MESSNGIVACAVGQHSFLHLLADHELLEKLEQNSIPSLALIQCHDFPLNLHPLKQHIKAFLSYDKEGLLYELDSATEWLDVSGLITSWFVVDTILLLAFLTAVPSWSSLTVGVVLASRA
jgi:hypothetical protein